MFILYFLNHVTIHLMIAKCDQPQGLAFNGFVVHANPSMPSTAYGFLVLSEMIMRHHPISNSSPPAIEEKEVRSPSPNIILRRDNDFLSAQKSAWDSTSDAEEEAEVKVPDVHRDDLASRRAYRGPINPKVHQFVPPPVCSNKDRERWEGIRRASQQTLQEKEKEIRLATCVCVVCHFICSNYLKKILSHFSVLSFGVVSLVF